MRFKNIGRPRRPRPIAPVTVVRDYAAEIFEAESAQLLDRTHEITRAALDGRLPAGEGSPPSEAVDFVRRRKRSLARKLTADVAMLELRERLERDDTLRALHAQYGAALQEAMLAVLAEHLQNQPLRPAEAAVEVVEGVEQRQQEQEG